MSVEADVQRAPVPVWLFSSPEAIEYFVSRSSEVRTGHEEYDLLLNEVAGIVDECCKLSPGWIERNFSSVAALLPDLHRRHLSIYPSLTGSYREHLGHWLLRDSFVDRDELPTDVRALLQIDGFSGSLALLAADNCIQMLAHWHAIHSKPTLEMKTDAMQAALTVYGRAILSVAFMHQVIPFEADMTTSQACARAQRSSQAGYADLKMRALAQWEKGRADGRWSYGVRGKKAPRGRGPRDAAIAIAVELAPLAQERLQGKQAQRGIAAGSEDQIYRWILEAQERL